MIRSFINFIIGKQTTPEYVGTLMVGRSCPHLGATHPNGVASVLCDGRRHLLADGMRAYVRLSFGNGGELSGDDQLRRRFRGEGPRTSAGRILVNVALSERIASGGR